MSRKTGLLLVLLAIPTIYVVINAWVTTYTPTTGESGELLTIKSVDWSNSSQVVVEVINTGTADAEITEVSFGGQTSAYSAKVDSDGGTITLIFLYSWQLETTYELVIRTKANVWEFEVKEE